MLSYVATNGDECDLWLDQQGKVYWATTSHGDLAGALLFRELSVEEALGLVTNHLSWLARAVDTGDKAEVQRFFERVCAELPGKE